MRLARRGRGGHSGVRQPGRRPLTLASSRLPAVPLPTATCRTQCLGLRIGLPPVCPLACQPASIPAGNWPLTSARTRGRPSSCALLDLQAALATARASARRILPVAQSRWRRGAIA